MVFRGVQNVIRQGGGFHHRVNSRLQALHQNLTAVCRGAVDGVAGVSNGSNFEGNTVQSRPVRAGFDQPQAGLFCIGEHKFGGVVGSQVDDALGVVHHIAGALQLRYLVGAGGEIAQVDLAISVRDKLLGAVAAVDGPDAELHTRNGFGRVRAVNLHQLHAGLGIIEEKQLLNATASSQLNLLGSGVLDVAVISGVHLHCPVGAGFDAGQEDLAAGNQELQHGIRDARPCIHDDDVGNAVQLGQVLDDVIQIIPA